MTDMSFPTLPEGKKRFSVEQLLITCAPHLGLRGARLHALLYMMKQTAPDDWIRSDREPVFFAPQDQTAAALGKSRRALYNDEAALEDLGLIEKRVKANGGRSAYGRCGIVFSRLIALVPDLLALNERLKSERNRRRELCNRRSAYLRLVKRRLEDLTNLSAPIPQLAVIIQAYESWPQNAQLHRLGINALEEHLMVCRTLCETLDEIPVPCPETAARPAENFPCHKQENIEEFLSVPCMAAGTKRRSGQSTSNITIGSECQSRSEDCREKRIEKDREATSALFLARLTPDRMFQLAGDDMQSLLIACCGSRAQIRERDLIDAATRMLSLIDINSSAWAKAVHTMGEFGAALCVLLLDANRSHPTHPVRNPGGALRAMTVRYRAGKLNLVGSFIGLSRRRSACASSPPTSAKTKAFAL